VSVGETSLPCDHDSQAGYALLSNEPVIVKDLASESRFAPGPLLTDHGVVSGMSVVIPDRYEPYGVLAVHTLHRRRFTVHDTDFLRSVAHVIGGAVQADDLRQQIESQSCFQERRLRYQVALAECAEALLVNSGDDQQRRAAEALLSATDADHVFIERNVVDPDLGFCSQTVAEFESPGLSGSKVGNPYWDLVPWDRMPTSRSYLERGEPFVVIPDQLEGVEHEQYAADPFPIASELNIPISVDGEWAGLVAFSNIVVREWTDEDVSLLTTAARMIGAFWERGLARERLRNLLRSKDELIGSISHELRTPLTAVIGYGQMLHQDDSGFSAEERAEMIRTILEESLDLANIVDDLLVAAMAEAGTLRVVTASVDLRAQTAQVLEILPSERVGHIELTGASGRAVGDPARVRQVLRNLISNALRYGGDTIRVSVSSDDSTVRVAVSDNGPGIPTEERERIFESYKRATQAPGLTDSLGLGLSISRKLARLMDGDLTYRHHHGESIFELLLPKAE
jgi:signal transduction histidine kinase